MFWLVYINVQKITHLAQNVKYFSCSLDDSFSQLSKEVRLLCWDSRKSKQRKWSDVFQKIKVDINSILICGTKLRTFKQKVRPQWILLWCIFMWTKLGTNLSTPWKIYLRNIRTLHHKKAELRILLQHSVCPTELWGTIHPFFYLNLQSRRQNPTSDQEGKKIFLSKISQKCSVVNKTRDLGFFCRGDFNHAVVFSIFLFLCLLSWTQALFCKVQLSSIFSLLVASEMTAHWFSHFFLVITS